MENLDDIDDILAAVVDPLLAAQQAPGAQGRESIAFHQQMLTLLPAQKPERWSLTIRNVCAHLASWYRAQVGAYDTGREFAFAYEVQQSGVYILSLMHQLRQFCEQVTEGAVDRECAYTDRVYCLYPIDSMPGGNFTEQFHQLWRADAQRYDALEQPGLLLQGNAKPGLNHTGILRHSYGAAHMDHPETKVGFCTVESEDIPCPAAKQRQIALLPGSVARHVQRTKERIYTLKALGFSAREVPRNYCAVLFGLQAVRAALKHRHWLSLQLFQEDSEAS